MKGTILDFLNLVVEKPELGKELFELAAKHDFEFSDELNNAELEDVAGGTSFQNCDQKTNQAYNLFNQIIKSMNEMRRTATKNML